MKRQVVFVFLYRHFVNLYLHYLWLNLPLYQLDIIHCSVKNSLLHVFEAVLKEGKCYRIDKLNVGLNDTKFPTTTNKYKLAFMPITSCCTLRISNIPLNHFVFTPFADVLASPKDDLIVGEYFPHKFLPNVLFVSPPSLTSYLDQIL